MKIRITATAIAAIVFAASSSAQDLNPVGVAKVDITPTYAVRLSGYGGRRTEHDGVEQAIFAKALAIGSKADTVVILTVDNLGVPDSMLSDLAAKLKAKHGVARERIAICSSHTHCAPMLTNVAPTLFGLSIPPEHQKNIDRYTRELADKLEQVASASLANRKPAALTWAKGKVPFAANRRTAGGPVDHDLPVLRVTDEKGNLRALLVNYACHCTTLDFNRIHGDWAGTAQELLERSHPGVIAMIAIGCGADANPAPRGNTNLALQHGESITREVSRLMLGAWKPLPGTVSVKYSRIDLPFDALPTRADWEARAKQAGAVGYHAQVQLKKLDAGQSIQTKLDYPIQTFTFGDKLAMVFLPGEVVVDYSLRLKKEYDAERMWVNGYANDAPCYIPSARILREGGYEGGGAMIYYDRPTRLGPNTEELIFAELRKQLPAEFKAPKDPKEFPPPKSARDSLACIKLRPGFRAELVASEPLIESPVAIDWGADGRLWVVEMFDYPMGLDGKFKPGGRVKYLEDTNGDGVYDKATILASDLPFPTGVMAWRGGVLVCAAPDIVYLEDTKRDGQCDVRRTLFTGFATENYQARVNSLRYGLDGWIYAANGLLGGKITSKIGSQKTIELGGRDLRFKPDTGELEAVAGLSQQGRDRDDWGSWFGCDNSNILRHFPLSDHYLRRNPNFVPPPPFVNVPTGDPEPNRLFPASHVLNRFNDFGHVSRVTSACSSTIYRDELLGPLFRGNSFTCEAVHNVVTRRVLTPKGSTFIGRRADDEQTAEFVASTDNWFRPVEVRTGPDGALWIVDMYRFVIEHPRWIPPDRLAELDVRAGANMGRIYRIVPDKAPAFRMTRFDRSSLKDLERGLDSANGVVRDLCQRVLIERNVREAIPQLNSLVRSGKPYGRLHSLWTLHGLGELKPETIEIALRDPHPGVRRNAIQLAEPHLASSKPLLAAFYKLLDDNDPGVRFQAICSMGFVRDESIGEELGKWTQMSSTDPYMEAAALSSINRHNLPRLLESLMNGGGRSRPQALVLTKVAGMAPFIFEPAEMQDRLKWFVTKLKTYPIWNLPAVAAMLDGMERRNSKLVSDSDVAAMISILAEQGTKFEPSFPGDERAISHPVVGIQLLGRSTISLTDDIQTLSKLISPRRPPAVQLAAIDRLGQINHADVPKVLLADWASKSPAIRARTIDAFLSRDATWVKTLLEAVEKNQVAASEFDAARRQRLLSHRDESVRRRSAEALRVAIDANRQKVVSGYADVAKLSGDAQKGAAVFVKSCSACHRIGEVGNAVGPDLAALTDRTPAALLIAILDPNRALDGRYSNFTALTKRGQQFSGMILADSSASITLAALDGKKMEILRSDLEELSNTGKSFMPEGLEKDIAMPAMADLISFLQSIGKPPKQVAGNSPKPVAIEADGSWRLRASDCEIHGGEITFESPFSNLGMWHGENDHAVWTVPGLKTGRYRVELHYACDNGSAGNTVLIQAGEAKLTWRIAGTGQWSNYVNIPVGELNLTAASSRVSIRPQPPLRGALLDLKELRLIPTK